MVENQFKEYTDHLAAVLTKKNAAYGDSFTKSVNTYGLKVIGIRLSDKYNRIENLLTHSKLEEYNESLKDTLLDMAGYSILALKYLDNIEVTKGMGANSLTATYTRNLNKVKDKQNDD